MHQVLYKLVVYLYKNVIPVSRIWFQLTNQQIIVGRVDQHSVSSQWTNETNHRVSQIGAIVLEIEVAVHRNENMWAWLLQHGKKMLDNVFFTHQSNRCQEQKEFWHYMHLCS